MNEQLLPTHYFDKDKYKYLIKISNKISPNIESWRDCIICLILEFFERVSKAFKFFIHWIITAPLTFQHIYSDCIVIFL